MTEVSSVSLSPSWKRRALMAILLSVVSIALVQAASPSRAEAARVNWCTNVYLAPLPSGNECHMPTNLAAYHMFIGVDTQERAGCVRILGYYGEPLSSWQCVGNYSSTQIYNSGAPGFYRGAIRNNNLSNWGHFSGYTICCKS
jgi:hypothetical protein